MSFTLSPATAVAVKAFDFADGLIVRKGHLPHWRQEGCAYFVTFRLADSLPQPLLREWAEVRRNWLERHPLPLSDTEAEEYHERFTERMEKYLHSGRGSCAFATPANAIMVENVLRHDDGKLYELGTFVVMPNHVHALVLPRAGVELSTLLGQWKGIAARRINDLSATTGSLWAPETYDHIVRNQRELMRLDVYIRANPVKAGLREGTYRIGGSVAHWFFSTSGTPA